MVRTAIALCITLLMASPALACGVMEKTEPRVGSIVEPTDHITLTFTKAIVAGSNNIRITDAAGNEVEAGKPMISDDNTVLSLKTDHLLASGKYKVLWNVIWQDCNSKTQGDYKFTVK